MVEETTADALRVRHDELAHRYEGSLDGRVVVVADYLLRPGTVVFVHTEVDRAFENRGLATRLLDEALRDVRSRRLKVAAGCSFVRLHLARHAEEYADLL